jgi:hypothetical protein
MPLASLRFKHHPAAASMPELSQARQGGFPAPAQIGENPVDYQVQAVGGLGLADARPAGQLPGDIALPHFFITVAGGPTSPAGADAPISCKSLKIQLLGNWKNAEVSVTHRCDRGK